MKALLGILMMLSVTAARAEMVLTPTQTPEFCMQNFNAYGPLYAPNTSERMEWIGSLLQAAPRCGVIQLQEVWNSSNIDQIENALKYNYQISSPNRDNKIGVMSLFDGAIKGAWTYQFNINNLGGFLDEIRETFGVMKAFHIVQAQLPGMGEDFYFVNTHLHPTSTEIRITQIIDMLNWRLQNPNLKMLMSGDFNANEKSFEREFMMSLMGLHDSFAEALGGSYPPGYCSYCETNPHSWMSGNHMLDYIFVSNAGGANTRIQPVAGELNMRGPLREPLSDHYGVRVSFKLAPGGSDSLTGSQWIQRRDKALALIGQAQQILVDYGDRDLKPYIAELQNFSDQIQTQQGPYYQYFGQFR
ncbi:endonuclease/exonuclease/phosphatase family protein [Bdellovibrio sp. HCB290]|uniref:endonuclease/exonuclease/phosphatase family protein n=1 Tax=Bdellovibrio sp. HCB290 TaxID=3394356 RepID=UPI0039B376C7